MGSKVAPIGTITVRELAFPPVTTAFTAPKYTVFLVVAGSKPVPVIVTRDPTAPEAGEKEVITGLVNQVKEATEELPPAFVTVTLPLAPVPTMAVISVEELTVKESAFIPPMVTAVPPVKEVPLICRMVPWVP